VTGQLLDEAAAFAEEQPPRLDTKLLRELLDPENFIRSHSNKGGTAPQEAGRMLQKRLEELKSVSKEHRNRKQRIEDAEVKLNKTVEDILGD
jgi:hypothetical protein